MQLHKTKETSKVDLGPIADMYRHDADAKKVFDHLAERERDRAVIGAANMEHYTRVEARHVVRIFRELEKAHAGRVIDTADGIKNVKFRWDISMTQLARVIKKSATVPATTVWDVHKNGNGNGHKAEETHQEGEGVEHYYRLRRNFEVVLFLPEDGLSAHEAERLAAYIKTLPVTELAHH